ncbi:MAG TPA: hypothetical protein VMS60_04165 [Solirubrobacterales bacterium]|nr:hypothetical protein [Solirubrobacterales bacterium]
MPSRLRPTASLAADAVLVGDPGRALALAQVLLEQPKMSNHARGLWGYSGQTPAGRALTVQSTGMGGPSAALVLADLAELGLRRAVRVGTCVAIDPAPAPGDLLLVGEAQAWGGGGGGEPVPPDEALTARLRETLGGDARPATVASLDFLHRANGETAGSYAERVDAADMQTATLLAGAADHGVEIAAVLIVAESAGGEQADDEALAAAAERAGAAAAAALG